MGRDPWTDVRQSLTFIQLRLVSILRIVNIRRDGFISLMNG